MLRFEATARNTKDLNVDRVLDKFPNIIAKLGGITEQFCTALDCVDIGFLTDTTLEDLTQPSQLGAVRVGAST